MGNTKRYLNDKISIIAIFAAFFVLFSAMISPRVSASIAIWKIFNKKRQTGELLLMLGTIMFVGGAVGYITRQLPAEQIQRIGALTLIFMGAGAGMKKIK